jgi:predicted ester cyclase
MTPPIFNCGHVCAGQQHILRSARSALNWAIASTQTAPKGAIAAMNALSSEPTAPVPARLSALGSAGPIGALRRWVMADLNALGQRFYDEVISQGKLDVIDELVADDFVEHQELPGVPPGKEGIRVWVTMFRDAFPDLKAEVLSMAVDGDELWVHGVMTGTHQGEFAGIAPTGKTVSVTAFDRVKIRDNKAIAHWGASDDLGMMTQLGAIPPMG